MNEDEMIVQIGDERLLDPYPWWREHEGLRSTLATWAKAS